MNIQVGDIVKKKKQEYIIMGIIDNDIMIMPKFFYDNSDNLIKMYTFEYTDTNKFKKIGTMYQANIMNFILKHKMTNSKILVYCDGLSNLYGENRSIYVEKTFSDLDIKLQINVYKWSEIKRQPLLDIYVIMNGEKIQLNKLDYQTKNFLKSSMFMLMGDCNNA